MKKWNKYLLFSLLLLTTACRQNEMMDYALSGRVYFYERYISGTIDNKIVEKNYSFALQHSSLMLDTLRINTKLMGYLADYDRIFRAEIVPEKTTAVEGKHFTLLDGVMKAGEYEAALPVVIYRTEDTQQVPVSLFLRLTATDDFLPGNPDDITFLLSWGDMLMKPEHWPDYYFGPYSVNKYRFAIDVTGHTDWPQAERVTSGKQEGIYTITEIQREADKCNDAYAEYRELYGPIYEDDDADPKVEIYFGI